MLHSFKRKVFHVDVWDADKGKPGHVRSIACYQVVDVRSMHIVAFGECDTFELARSTADAIAKRRANSI